MKRTSPPRPAIRAPFRVATGIAASLAICLASPSSSYAAPSPQDPRAEIESAKGNILAVVDPRSTHSAQESPFASGVVPTDLVGAIRSLMDKGESEAIFQIGIGAVPALRTLAEQTSLRDLVLAHESTSPLYYLSRMAPLEVLSYHEARLDDDIARFQALAFIDNGGLMDAIVRLQDKDQQSQALPLIERACTDPRLDEPFRLRLATEALGTGLSSEKTEGLLLANEAAWFKRTGITEALADLYVRKKGLPPVNIAPNLAAILWGHSLEVDRILAQHTDPKVRVELADRMIRANTSSNMFPPAITVRIPLLIEQALREDSPLRPRLFAAVEHTLQPSQTSPTVPMDTLIELVANSAEEASLSSRLAAAIGYQVSHRMGSIVDIPEQDWLLLLRAIASCSDPKLKARYMGDIDRYVRFPHMKMAYAMVIAEGGDLPADRFFPQVNSFIGEVTSPAEQADVRLRIAQLFEEDEEHLAAILDQDHPFDALDSTRLRDAVRFYGGAGFMFRKKAAEDASRWGEREAPLLAELCANSDLSWRARAIAALGLLESHDPRDGALAAEVLIEQGKDQVELVASLIRSRPNRANEWKAWTELVASVLKDVETRPELVDILPYDVNIYYATISQRADIVAGATSMARIASASNKLSNLSDDLTTWMIQDPTLQDDSLILPLLRLRPWRGANTDLPGLALSRPKIRAEAMQLLLAGVRDGQGGERLIPSILHAVNEEELDNLVQAVTESSNPKLLDVLETRLATMARLKAAQQRWSAASSSTPTKQAAIGKVLALLESGDEDVRVEAILGLSTLGAVEALPTLIGIVGRGSAREKAAAKESLTFLRQVARNQAYQDARQDPRGGIPHRPVVAPQKDGTGKQ